jgi:hypothetical protein
MVDATRYLGYGYAFRGDFLAGEILFVFGFCIDGSDKACDIASLGI